MPASWDGRVLAGDGSGARERRYALPPWSGNAATPLRAWRLASCAGVAVSDFTPLMCHRAHKAECAGARPAHTAARPLSPSGSRPPDRDQIALSAEALVLLASSVHVLRHRLQARCRLWGTPWRRAIAIGRDACPCLRVSSACTTAWAAVRCRPHLWRGAGGCTYACSTRRCWRRRISHRRGRRTTPAIDLGRFSETAAARGPCP